jgi:hypothetical protein
MEDPTRMVQPAPSTNKMRLRLYNARSDPAAPAAAAAAASVTAALLSRHAVL